MMKYVSVAQMQAIEREANARGLSYEMMMENAGHGLADVILEDYSELKDEGAFGLVGSGNNGGDTLVALTILAEAGWRVGAAIVSSRLEADPLVARFIKAGGHFIDFVHEPNFDQLGMLAGTYAILLDGVLGTGTRLPLRGHLPRVLDSIRTWLNNSDIKPLIIAVDCPSGIDCDTGEAAPECIQANRTITMAAVKQGLLKFPAYQLIGDLDVVEIGLPNSGEGLETWKAIGAFVPEAEWVCTTLPPRPLDSHKGTFGTALIVAGSTSYTGAALLAGKAAARMGTGLVTLAVAETLHTALAGHFPEATWLILPQEGGFISEAASQLIINNIERVSCMLLGCGFGLQATTGRFLSDILGEENLPPLVIDADGLKLLGQIDHWWKRLPEMTVLTPHPGEMSLLTGLSTQEIQATRLETASHYSKMWGQVIVLKGAFTVIAAPDGRQAIIPVASAALAHAGTGDVLAGLITGFIAQHVPAFEASVTGAWIHASAGLRAAVALGNTASVLAGDVLNCTAEALSELQHENQ